jgi:hypothetical protein
VSKELIECWAGRESAFDPSLVNRTNHKGLFQLGAGAWADSGTSAPYSKALDPAANTTAAIGYISVILLNRVGQEALDAGNVSQTDIAYAVTKYLDGPYSKKRESSVYASQILNCEKALKSGDWDAAMTAIGK